MYLAEGKILSSGYLYLQFLYLSLSGLFVCSRRAERYGPKDNGPARSGPKDNGPERHIRQHVPPSIIAFDVSEWYDTSNCSEGFRP